MFHHSHSRKFAHRDDSFDFRFDTVDSSDSNVGVNINLLANSGAAAFIKKGAITTNAPMLDGENGYSVVPILTIGESVPGDNGSTYTPIGILDGIGAYKLDASTVRIFVNHEAGPNVGATYEVSDGQGGSFELQGARISYFDIDIKTKAIKEGGVAINQIYDATGQIATNNDFTIPNLSGGVPVPPDGNDGFNRFCSGSLYEGNTFGPDRGVTETIYFAGEETGGAFSTIGGQMWALEADTGTLWAAPDMGRGAWENVTQVDTGTTTHVAFILSDDTAPFNVDADAALEKAPLYLYVGEKSSAPDANFLEKNGLSGGKLYVWKANDPAATSFENFSGNGSTAAGTWVEISTASGTPSDDGSTGFDQYGNPTQKTLWQLAEAAGAFGFSRPEDVSTNPSNGQEFVLASTGVPGTPDANGTVYTMTLDFTNISAPAGTLEVLHDGNDDPTEALRSPDNLDWADSGYIYVQEDDANGALFDGTPPNPNEASILRIDPSTGAVTRVAEIDRGAVSPIGSTDNDPTDVGDWEGSGILDVSSLFGEKPGTLLLTSVQAHSIRDGAIGGNGALVEGGQLAFVAAPAVNLEKAFPGLNVVNLEGVTDIVGSKKNDVLIGDQNANVIEGNAGDDLMKGNAGGDTFVFKSRDGDDVVYDFNAAAGDKLDFSDFRRIDTVAEALSFASQENRSVVFDFGKSSVTLIGVDIDDLAPAIIVHDQSWCP